MIEHRATCPWNGGDPCDCGSARPARTSAPPPGGGLPDAGYAGPGLPTLAEWRAARERVDAVADQLTAVGDVLAAAVELVATGYAGADACLSGCHAAEHVSPLAFLALAAAVESAQPGAVEQARKAAGR